jgi:tetratricopeptide (TPR) repeat protein
MFCAWAALGASVFAPAAAAAQQDRKSSGSKVDKQEEVVVQEPPEEDEDLKPKQYSFNPLQSAKEMKVGDFYFKKGSYKGAARRYREATRWDPTSAHAFLRLGEAEEKLNDEKAAREAYSKYLQLQPTGKDAEHIRKKLARNR